MSRSDTAVAAPRRAAAQPRSRRLHRWLAYVFAAFFIVQGLSGSLLVLADPLDDWLNPELTVAPAARKPLVEMADALQRRHPDVQGLGLTRIDQAGRLVTGFWPTPDPLIPSENRYWLARMHPASGAELSVMPYGGWSFHRHDLIGLFYALHTSLTLGAIGKLLQMVSAGFLLLLLASGLANMVNRRRALRHKAPSAVVDHPPARLHRRLGALSALVLAILLASGIALQFETLLDPAYGYRSAPAQGRRQISLRQAWSAAHARYPAADTRLIMSPFVPGGVFRIGLVVPDGQGAGKEVELFVDAYSGAVQRERRSDEGGLAARLPRLFESLHGGKVLGVAGQALAFVAGLLPLAFLYTGLALGRRRRRN